MPAEFAADVGATLLQVGPDVDVSPAAGVLSSAVSSFLTTLIVGGLLVAIVPDYTERTTDRLEDEPVESFLYGLVLLIALIVISVVLVITLVGILVAIPLLILTGLVWVVGTAIGFLTIGERLVGREDGWFKPLLVGAAIDGALVLTGIGGIVSFAVGAAGFGAVLGDWLK